MQIINKKCPYCSAIFKVKSALESHLQTKHVDKQMINIDAIPEISFANKEAPFGAPNPANLSDLGSANLPQPMNVDFWKAKMMQQPQAPQFFAGNRKRSEFSESEISFTDSNNDEIPDEDYDMDNFNDDSNHAEEFQNTTAPAGEVNKSKRHRTHVNRVQKSILRKIFDDVKSPSMVDCENIGREIGLFKRVVQVVTRNFKLSSLLKTFILCPTRFGSKTPEPTTRNVTKSQPTNSNISQKEIRRNASFVPTLARWSRKLSNHTPCRSNTFKMFTTMW